MVLVWNGGCLAETFGYAVTPVRSGDLDQMSGYAYECLEPLRGVYDRGRLLVLVRPRSKIVLGDALRVKLAVCELGSPIVCFLARMYLQFWLPLSNMRS